ncbi:hypothetical protein FRB96_004282 [Tulasnella sp. 330]|nr:hypothetical protein FRB96_004282 [Tulasnella sp. 330]
MDDMDTVGRYGTVALVRKLTFESVTSYPVDDERTTFGRDPKCSIRMYFHAVDPLHCTLYFEDGKAYLQVTGQGGVVVDDTHVPPGETVCLNNSSRFMIWKKLFEFTYPPREIRSQLLATPRHASSKSLRMSMIRSAVILTPNIVTSQALDLRALQSPVRPYREAPHEQVTFVESNQVAVVEDGVQYSDASVLQNPFARRTGDEDERALVALEEVEEEETDEVDERFARNTPTRPTHNAFSGHGSPAPRLFTPQLSRTPSATTFTAPPFTLQHRYKFPQAVALPTLPQLPLNRTSSSILSVSSMRSCDQPSEPPLSTIPPTPGRGQLPQSRLYPRYEYRAAVASGLDPIAATNSQLSYTPPRTPTKKRSQGRPSLHKAVLVRSAHKAYVQAMNTKKEEAEEEMEVEEAVSPERELRHNKDDAGEEDAEGEEQYEEYEEEVSSTPGGVVQGTLNLLGNLVPSFMRKSVSPGKSKQGMSSPALALEPGHDTDSDHEENAFDEQDTVGGRTPSAQPSVGETSITRPLSPATAVFAKTEDIQLQPTPITASILQDSQQPRSFSKPAPPVLKTWDSATCQTGNMTGKGKSIDPAEPANFANFLTPQIVRAPTMTTNTVARPYANPNRLTPTGLRTAFLGKPSRSVKALDLSLDMKAQELPLEEEATEESEKAFKDSIAKVEDEVDEESARQQKELRTKQRQSLLAALDAEPRRHMGSGIAARRSSIFRKSFGASTGLPSTPGTRPHVSTTNDNPFLVGGSEAALESDLTDEEDEEEEQKLGGFEQLKANMERAKRESLYRSTRLSLGGPLSPAKKVLPQAANDVEEVGPLTFKLLQDTQSSSTQASSRASDASTISTESNSSIEAVEDAVDEDSGAVASVGGNAEVEVDITEADPEEHVPSAPVSPLVEHFYKDEAKIGTEPEPVEKDESDQVNEEKDVQPAVDEISPMRPTRGKKQTKTPSTTQSSATRSAKKKSRVGEELEIEAEVKEEEIPLVPAVRRGRSRSKTPAPILETLVSPPMTRARRGASTAPSPGSRPSLAKTRSSVSPSKKRTPSATVAPKRTHSNSEDEDEEMDVDSPAPIAVARPKTVPVKRSVSRIGQLRAPPQTGPPKGSARTAKTVDTEDEAEGAASRTKVVRRPVPKATVPKAVASTKSARPTASATNAPLSEPIADDLPVAKPATTRGRFVKPPPAPAAKPYIAGPSRGAGGIPAPVGTVGKRKRPSEEDDDIDAPATAGKAKQVSISATRVQRSTRAKPVDVKDDDATVEDSGPRKRRKAAVKEEEEELVRPAETGPTARKVSASRVPSTSVPRRIPSATTATGNTNTTAAGRRTSNPRNVSDGRDKENTPGSAPAQLEIPKTKLKPVRKVAPHSAPVIGPSNTRATASQEKNATAVSRSLRTRAKK